MIFQEHVVAQPHGYMNANEAMCEWLQMNTGEEAIVSYADPETTERIFSHCHHQRGLLWSYGGWLEDRSTLWRDTYLKAEHRFIHIGVDFNVPRGTLIRSPQIGKVVYTGTDAPLEGGWGYHVIVKHETPWKRYALLYAHLDSYLPCNAGTPIHEGETIGFVGSPEMNGGWYSHVHVQVFENIDAVTDWKAFSEKMDGYVHKRDRDAWARMCPDPMQYLW